MTGGKLCKIQDCSRPRLGNQSLCGTHYRERTKKLKEEKAAKKLLKKQGTKKFQDKERKTLIKKCDAVFSKVIRTVDACLYCGKTSAQAQLHCSHVYSRKNLSVRWDTMNAKCLCAYHHRRFWHEQPKEAIAWLTGLWGEEHMKELEQRAASVKQWTIPELKELLENLNAKLL